MFAFENLSHFTPCKYFFPVVSPYFLDIANSCLTVVQMLGDAGFDDVIAEDRTDQVCEDLCLCTC
jgi:hypothetical protein